MSRTLLRPSSVALVQHHRISQGRGSSHLLADYLPHIVEFGLLLAVIGNAYACVGAVLDVVIQWFYDIVPFAVYDTHLATFKAYSGAFLLKVACPAIDILNNYCAMSILKTHAVGSYKPTA